MWQGLVVTQKWIPKRNRKGLQRPVGTSYKTAGLICEIGGFLMGGLVKLKWGCITVFGEIWVRVCTHIQVIQFWVGYQYWVGFKRLSTKPNSLLGGVQQFSLSLFCVSYTNIVYTMHVLHPSGDGLGVQQIWWSIIIGTTKGC